MIVDQHIVIAVPVADLVRGALHPRGDHFVAVGVAAAQAPFEFLHRRRQDEDAHDVGAGLLIKLLRALPIDRSEEHTSELQSLMRISYAVFCLKKKNTIRVYHTSN